jgi:hypothetical protein
MVTKGIIRCRYPTRLAYSAFQKNGLTAFRCYQAIGYKFVEKSSLT